MIIEDTTAYAYKVKRADNLTFDKVRAIAKKFIDDLPQDDVNELYDELNHGIDQLTTEPQMLTYLYSFGNMHQAKLNRAFEQLPDAFLQQPEIRIVDYGCGQAIGTMCYADFLADRGLSQTIKSVTLIEPSEICLKRAALHVSQFFPDAEICTVCKPFDDLTDNDLANSADIPTLHILSNVLDIQAFDLEDFATLIDNNLNNYNQFVCVGPYFSYSDKDERMTEFAELLDGNVSFSKIFEKGELCDGKTWTAQIVCFSVKKLLGKKSIVVSDMARQRCEVNVSTSQTITANLPPIKVRTEFTPLSDGAEKFGEKVGSWLEPLDSPSYLVVAAIIVEVIWLIVGIIYDSPDNWWLETFLGWGFLGWLFPNWIIWFVILWIMSRIKRLTS